MDYSQIAHTFSNGITVVNTTPHPITFQNPEGGIDIVPSSVQEGEKTGYAVVNATPIEKEYAPHVVDTMFEGNEQGQKIIDEIKSQFAEAEKAGNLMIIGSMIAANAYPDIKGMCPAPGFERVPPAEKRMSCEKFTQGQATEKGNVNFNMDKYPALEEYIWGLAYDAGRDTNGEIEYIAGLVSHIVENESRQRISEYENLSKYAKDENYSVREAIAKRPDLTPELIKQLAKDEDYSIRATIAERPDLSQELIEQLAKDKTHYVHEVIAKRPDLSPELIEQLAKDENCYVRKAIAKRPDLSQELIKQLAKDEDYSIRATIAEHPDLSQELIEQLAKDKYCYVREAIAKRPDQDKASLLADQMSEKKVYLGAALGFEWGENYGLDSSLWWPTAYCAELFNTKEEAEKYTKKMAYSEKDDSYILFPVVQKINMNEKIMENILNMSKENKTAKVHLVMEYDEERKEGLDVPLLKDAKLFSTIKEAEEYVKKYNEKSKSMINPADTRPLVVDKTIIKNIKDKKTDIVDKINATLQNLDSNIASVKDEVINDNAKQDALNKIGINVNTDTPITKREALNAFGDGKPKQQENNHQMAMQQKRG